MVILLKTRQMIADEFGFNIQKLMRLLKQKNIEMPKRVLLLPPDQKRIYDAIYYPKCVNKELYSCF